MDNRTEHYARHVQEQENDSHVPVRASEEQYDELTGSGHHQKTHETSAHDDGSDNDATTDIPCDLCGAAVPFEEFIKHLVSELYSRTATVQIIHYCVENVFATATPTLSLGAFFIYDASLNR